jgi:hypothetical protein
MVSRAHADVTQITKSCKKVANQTRRIFNLLKMNYLKRGVCRTGKRVCVKSASGVRIPVSPLMQRVSPANCSRTF